MKSTYEPVPGVDLEGVEDVEGAAAAAEEEQQKKRKNRSIFCGVIALIVIAAIVFGPFPPPPSSSSPGDDDSTMSLEIECSTTEQYTGSFTSDTANPIPFRSNIGCVDLDAYHLRNSTEFPPEGGNTLTTNIYGPMEDGFFSKVPGMSCLGDNTVSSGIDTHTAELIVHYLCQGEEVPVLDTCGGHALPYHYHERMRCLYNSDKETRHSTRIGTAGDGNGIYGMYIDGGELPTDTDVCGGRWGVTPDSNGETVYYYPVKPYPPFTLGCYGPIESVQACRDLYPEQCGEDAVVEEITTNYGSGLYTLDCPCFDENHSNVLDSTESPGFLPDIQKEGSEYKEDEEP